MQIKSAEKPSRDQYSADTLIISARVDSFQQVFLGERSWYPVRIDDRRMKGLKWICAYQTSPIRAITHYARITKIEKYLETGRYRIRFSEPIAMSIPVVLGTEDGLTMQGQKYTRHDQLLKAKSLSDLKPWNQWAA